MARIENVEGRWRLSDAQCVVEVVPARGALVTSFSIGDDAVLFLDEATLGDPTKNVRGGVPLLFPFAGKAPAGSTLPQHGFARRLPWEVSGASADEKSARLECVLRDTDETRAAWPHAFELRYGITLSGARLTLEWTLTNRGVTPMPLHFGIHPYFRVGDKAGVQVEGTKGLAFDNTTQVERTVERVDFSKGEVDLHFATAGAKGTTLQRGDGSRVHLSWTEQFDTLVVWTLPQQPFVCVEPWTARGAQPAHQHLAPGAMTKLAVEVWREL